MLCQKIPPCLSYTYMLQLRDDSPPLHGVNVRSEPHAGHFLCNSSKDEPQLTVRVRESPFARRPSSHRLTQLVVGKWLALLTPRSRRLMYSTSSLHSQNKASTCALSVVYMCVCRHPILIIATYSATSMMPPLYDAVYFSRFL